MVCKLFWVKGNFSHRLERNFCLFLNHLKELAPNKRLSKITSFYLSIGQNKLLFTKHLFFLSSCNDPSMLWRHLTSSLAQEILYTDVPFLSLNLSHASGVSLMYAGFHSYVCIKFDYFYLANYSHVYLIIRPARRTSRVKFVPPSQFIKYTW